MEYAREKYGTMKRADADRARASSWPSEGFALDQGDIDLLRDGDQ